MSQRERVQTSLCVSLQLNEEQDSHGGYIVLIRKTITRVSYWELGRDVLGQVLIWNTGGERQNFHGPLWKWTETGPQSASSTTAGS